jgi:hypothetical protein
MGKWYNVTVNWSALFADRYVKDHDHDADRGNNGETQKAMR